MFIKIYTDGSARKNPNGFGGCACVIQYININKKFYEYKICEGYFSTTNNRMELMAAIVGLKSLLIMPCYIKLYSDSKYLVNAFNKNWINYWIINNWKCKNNKYIKNIDLWKKILKIKKKYVISFTWIKGHKYKTNIKCDNLANIAINNSNLLIDFGFELST